MGKDFGFESAIYTDSRTVGKDRRRLFWYVKSSIIFIC